MAIADVGLIVMKYSRISGFALIKGDTKEVI